MHITQRFLAVAGAAALLTAGATASASASTTKLDSATESGWGLYINTPSAVNVTNVAGKIQTWDVVNQGSGSWGGVSGVSYEFQEPGTNECLTWAHNILFSGDPTYLTTCLSNGTSWVANGSKLYSRYELNQPTPVKAVLVMSTKPTAGSASTVVQTSKLSGWASAWKGF
jgi:hypothetical protein